MLFTILLFVYMIGGIMRLSTFNLENLFDRAAIAIL